MTENLYFTHNRLYPVLPQLVATQSAIPVCVLYCCLIPPSKISTLTQGMFVGAVSDNFDERIDQKLFHAEIVVDNAKVAKETKAYKPIPVITDFTDEDGNDIMDEMVLLFYS